MIRIQAQQDIQRLPHAVFEYVRQPEYMPQWMHQVLEVREIREPTFQQNGQVFVVANVLGRKVGLLYRLSLTEHPLSFRLFSLNRPVPHAWHYKFEAHGSGTRVTVAIAGWPETFSRLTMFIVMLGLHFELHNMMVTLKNLMEIGVVNSIETSGPLQPSSTMMNAAIGEDFVYPWQVNPWLLKTFPIN